MSGLDLRPFRFMLHYNETSFITYFSHISNISLLPVLPLPVKTKPRGVAAIRSGGRVLQLKTKQSFLLCCWSHVGSFKMCF